MEIKLYFMEVQILQIDLHYMILWIIMDEIFVSIEIHEFTTHLLQIILGIVLHLLLDLRDFEKYIKMECLLHLETLAYLHKT